MDAVSLEGTKNGRRQKVACAFFCFTGNFSCKAKTLREDAHAAQVVVWLLMQPSGSARVPQAELFVLMRKNVSINKTETLEKQNKNSSLIF